MQPQFRPLIQVSPNLRRNVVAANGLITIMFWFGWQVINYWSTAEGLNLYFGYGIAQDVVQYFSVSGENWWVTVFATIIVGMDVMALVIFLMNAVFVTPDGKPLVDAEFAKSIFGGWLIATAFDALLTWYVFAYRAEQSILAGAMRGPEMAGSAAIGQAIPWGLTAMSWLASYFMLQSTKSAARAVLTGAPPQAPARPKPQGGGGKPQNFVTPPPQALPDKKPEQPAFRPPEKRPEAHQFHPVSPKPPTPSQGRGPHEEISPDMEAFMKLLNGE